MSTAADKRREGKELALPSNHQVLSNSGSTFHFFVDSAEGAAVSLNAEVIEARADAAEARLAVTEERLGNEPA